MPFVTHAQTIAELQAQVTALLARLSALQAELAGTTTPPPTTTTTTTTGSTYLPSGSVLTGGLSLTRDIGRDSSGADVTQLQQFLARDVTIYPSGQATGFFGPLTEAAVQRFQIACGLLSTGDYNTTGYGRVGPRTRAALLNGCGSAPSTGIVGGLINVTPTTGSAPFTTQISATVNTTNACDYGSYLLDFGDGSAPISLVVPAGRCSALQQVIAHTYTTPGAYTISLRVGTHKATTNVAVTGGTSPSGSTGGTSTGYSACIVNGGVLTGTSPRKCSIGGITYTEVITSATGDYVSANITSGSVPFDVTFTTRVNSNNSCTGGEYTLDFGDGQRASVPYPISCASQTSTVTHRYATVGTYNARLYSVPSANVSAATPVASTVITAGTSSSVDPQLTITPAYQGVFSRVRATFTLANACTAFTLNWGDNSTPASRAQGSGCSGTTDQQTLTHDYPSSASSANYTISLTYGPTGSQSSRNATVTIVGSY